MFSRMTRQKGEHRCRIKECHADKWIRTILSDKRSVSRSNICRDCPFVYMVNKLAELEDKEERLVDDGK